MKSWTSLTPSALRECQAVTSHFSFSRRIWRLEGKNSLPLHLPRVADGEKVKSHELCSRCPPRSSHLAAAYPRFSSRKKSQILQNSQLKEQLALSPTGGAGKGAGRRGEAGEDLSFAGSSPKYQEFPAASLTYQGWIPRRAVGKVLSEFIPVRSIFGSQKSGISHWLQAKQDGEKNSRFKGECGGVLWVTLPGDIMHCEIPEGHKAMEFQREFTVISRL